MLPFLSGLTMSAWLLLGVSLLESIALLGYTVPGTVITLVIGVVAAVGQEEFFVLLVFAWLGGVLGDVISYEVIRRSTVAGMTPELRSDVDETNALFKRLGPVAVLLGRFRMPVRPILTLVARRRGVGRLQFYPLALLASACWSFVRLAMGYAIGLLVLAAFSWLDRTEEFILLTALAVLPLVLIWKWMLRKGRGMVVVLKSILSSLLRSLKENPDVRRWGVRHPVLARFLSNRIVLRRFTGLPLTCVILLLLYHVSLLAGTANSFVSGRFATIDAQLLNLLMLLRTKVLLQFFAGVSMLIHPAIVVSLLLLLTALLWLQRRQAQVVILWASAALTWTATTALKWFFDRPRPSVAAVAESSPSFPSAHASHAIMLFGLAVYLFLRFGRFRWRTKLSAVFLGILLVLLVDFSRLYLGVHFLSDVVAGHTAGVIVLLLAIMASELIGDPAQRGSPLVKMPRAHAEWVSLAIAATLMLGMLFFPPKFPKIIESARQQPMTIGMPELPFLFVAGGALPQYTETLLGRQQEPVNLIVVARDTCVERALLGMGWRMADPISFGTLWQSLAATAADGPYPSAPMTPYFYALDVQTFGIQKETERRTIRSRHHARFWKTQFSTASGAVFVGTVSLDTGVKWGGLRLGLTHSIAPDIDTERDLLVEDLRVSGGVKSAGLLQLIKPLLGKNFTGDPFFTDGQAAVVILKPCE